MYYNLLIGPTDPRVYDFGGDVVDNITAAVFNHISPL